MCCWNIVAKLAKNVHPCAMSDLASTRWNTIRWWIFWLRVDSLLLCKGCLATKSGMCFFHSTFCSVDFWISNSSNFAWVWVGDAVHDACAQVRTLRRGCLWWVAPPCSTWIYLARGSTGRTFTRARGAPWVYQLYPCGCFILHDDNVLMCMLGRRTNEKRPNQNDYGWTFLGEFLV